MCGRYVLSLRPSQVRQRLNEQNMPAEEAPSDDDEQIRQSYNFAPGYHGLIYRATTNDRGTDATPLDEQAQEQEQGDGEPSPKKAKLSHPPAQQVDGLATKETKYKLQSAKWGLIPFWTKRSPDYANMLRTINCRDDSLIENRGMWTSMKQRKRCIVIAEGFYEWLKKNNGKEKIPHFTKRKDGQLMCFAGLWDCVQYEGSEEKLYTYTVITTDSNKQLKFLHDRMPVILEPGSEEMGRWLDPSRVGWDKQLQGMLKPFQGELECYPVDKGVGKVGNNSPSFIIPVDSKENKKNIANFFDNAAQKASPAKKKETDIKNEPDEDRETTIKAEDPESNAPLPKPEGVSESELSQAIKAETDDLDDEALLEAEKSPPRSVWTSPQRASPKITRTQPPQVTRKPSDEDIADEDLLEAEKSPPRQVFGSPTKKAAQVAPSTPSKTRSATSNAATVKTPKKGAEEGNRKITAFFGGK